MVKFAVFLVCVYNLLMLCQSGEPPNVSPAGVILTTSASTTPSFTRTTSTFTQEIACDSLTSFHYQIAQITLYTATTIAPTSVTFGRTNFPTPFSVTLQTSAGGKHTITAVPPAGTLVQIRCDQTFELTVNFVTTATIFLKSPPTNLPSIWTLLPDTTASPRVLEFDIEGGVLDSRLSEHNLHCSDLGQAMPTLGSCGNFLGFGVSEGKCTAISGCQESLPRGWVLFPTQPACEINCALQSTCRDIGLVANLGNCDNTLGVGVFQGQCAPIVGCVGRAVSLVLFSSVPECRRVCGATSCNDRTTVNFGNCGDSLGVVVRNGICTSVTGCTQPFPQSILPFASITACSTTCRTNAVCQEWASVTPTVLGSCIEVLGYGVHNSGCEEIRGCSSSAAPYVFFQTQQTCEESCHIHSRCLDLGTVNFGPCAGKLGTAVINGKCTDVTGCPELLTNDIRVHMFGSIAECTRGCKENQLCEDFSFLSVGACGNNLGFGIKNGICRQITGCEINIAQHIVFQTREQCATVCSEATCRDLGRVSFGFCPDVIGAAVVNGRCKTVIGCRSALPSGTVMFNDILECEATCDITDRCTDDGSHNNLGTCATTLGARVVANICQTVTGCANALARGIVLYDSISHCQDVCGITTPQTNGRCQDFGETDFGSCGVTLGAVIRNGACRQVTGCADVIPAESFFRTVPECELSCDLLQACTNNVALPDYGTCAELLGTRVVDGKCTNILGCSDRLLNDHTVLLASTLQCNALCNIGVIQKIKTCVDVGGISSFGDCDRTLGAAVVNGVCTVIKGCEAELSTLLHPDLALFNNTLECAGSCDARIADACASIAPNAALWGTCVGTLGVTVVSGKCSPVTGCRQQLGDSRRVLFSSNAHCERVCNLPSQNVVCQDLGEIGFGSCRQFLGYAVINGKCLEVNGCPFLVPLGIDLFNNEAECKQTCRLSTVCSEVGFTNFGICTIELGYAVVGGRCRLLKGCVQDLLASAIVTFSSPRHCEAVCGSTTCLDFANVNRGNCGKNLGIGVRDNQCVPIGGCDGDIPPGFSLFDTVDACRAVCDVSVPIECNDISTVLAGGLGNCRVSQGVAVRDGLCAEIFGCDGFLPEKLTLWQSMQQCKSNCESSSSFQCRDTRFEDLGDCDEPIGVAVAGGDCTFLRGCNTGRYIPFASKELCQVTCLGQLSCSDVQGLQFGSCGFSLGAAVIRGHCTEITGCAGLVPPQVRLFRNVAACERGCGSGPGCRDYVDVDFGSCADYLGAVVVNGKCRNTFGCDEIKTTQPDVVFYRSVPECEDTCATRRINECQDVESIDFGKCNKALGAAVLQGICTTVVGCAVPLDFFVFADVDECFAACGGIAPIGCSNNNIAPQSTPLGTRQGLRYVLDGKSNTVWTSQPIDDIFIFNSKNDVSRVTTQSNRDTNGDEATSRLLLPEHSKDATQGVTLPEDLPGFNSIAPYIALKLSTPTPICRLRVLWASIGPLIKFHVTTNDNDPLTDREIRFTGDSTPGRWQSILFSTNPVVTFVSIRVVVDDINANVNSKLLAISEMQLFATEGPARCVSGGKEYNIGEEIPTAQVRCSTRCVCSERGQIECTASEHCVKHCTRADQVLVRLPDSCCPVCLTTNFQLCGAAAGTCQLGLRCIDDPRDDCALKDSMFCPGLCVTNERNVRCRVDDTFYLPGEKVAALSFQNKCQACVCASTGRVTCSDAPCRNVQCPQLPAGTSLRALVVTPPTACCGVCAATDNVGCIVGALPSNCKDGFACVDDPLDGCNPGANGKLNCPGLCTTLELEEEQCNKQCAETSAEVCIWEASTQQLVTVQNICKLEELQCRTDSTFPILWKTACTPSDGRLCSDLNPIKELLGTCNTVLGYGVLSGVCTVITGCQKLTNLHLFHTLLECHDACDQSFIDQNECIGGDIGGACALTYSPICATDSTFFKTFANACFFSQWRCQHQERNNWRFAYGWPCENAPQLEGFCVGGGCATSSTPQTTCPDGINKQGPSPDCVALPTKNTCVQLFETCPSCEDIYNRRESLGRCSRTLGIGIYEGKCDYITGCTLPSGINRLFGSFESCENACIEPPTPPKPKTFNLIYKCSRTQQKGTWTKQYPLPILRKMALSATQIKITPASGDNNAFTVISLPDSYPVASLAAGLPLSHRVGGGGSQNQLWLGSKEAKARLTSTCSSKNLGIESIGAVYWACNNLGGIHIQEPPFYSNPQCNWVFDNYNVPNEIEIYMDADPPPECADLTGIDFGGCNTFLGYGMMGVQPTATCTEIRGCQPSSVVVTLYDSVSDCQRVCGQVTVTFDKSQGVGTPCTAPSVTNGAITPFFNVGDDIPADTTLTVRCDAGYEVVGSPTVKCKLNGQYSTQFPICKLSTQHEITEVLPDRAEFGIATEVIIKGVRFTGVTAVLLDSITVPFVVNSEAEIVITVGSTIPAKLYDVIVKKPGENDARANNALSVEVFETIGEVKTIAVTTQFQEFLFTDVYQNPVVIVHPLSSAGDDPAVVRIKDVTSTSFKAKILERPDEVDVSHRPETVPFLVMEAGSWRIGNIDFVAGVKTNVGNNDGFVTINFGQSFVSPRVITQMQTTNHDQYASTRQRLPTASKVEMRVQEYITADNADRDEDVGYIVIDEGHNQFYGNNHFEAGAMLSDPQQVVDEGLLTFTHANLNLAPGATPKVFAWVASYNDPDTVILRQRSLTNLDVQLLLQENELLTQASPHAAEWVHYLVVQSDGRISNADGEAAVIPDDQKVACPESPQINNQVQTLPFITGSSELFIGDRIALSCPLGFDLNPSTSTRNTCTEGGWDRVWPTCVDNTPTIITVSPTTLPPSCDAVVTITGSRFTTLATVLVDNTAAVFDVIDDSTLTFVFPATLGAGTYDITLSKPGANDVSRQNILQAVTGAVMEIGQQQLTHIPVTVTLQQTFVNPIVIATALSGNGRDPASIRVMSVSGTSFRIYIAEPVLANGVDDGGAHGTELVSWMVVEQGTIELGGLQLEGGLRTFNNVIDKNTFVTINFLNAYTTTPVTISQIQTFNGDEFTLTRQRSTVSTLSVVMTELEGATGDSGGHVTESIAYVVIPQGLGTLALSAAKYEAGIISSADPNGEIYTFQNTYTTLPKIFAWIGSTNDGDMVILRYIDLTMTSVTFLMHEQERIVLGTTDHLPEDIHYFIVEAEGPICGTVS